MADRTGIEWTDATWNPVTGCTEVSPGCDHCYARTFAERWRGIPGHHFERGFDVQLRPEKLLLPLGWRRPRRVFVNSMSDLFHEQVPDTYIAQVFAVMAATPHHTYQVLTKRHGRMRSLLTDLCRCGAGHRPGVHFRSVMTHAASASGLDGDAVWQAAWPLPNVWLGMSIEDQKRADLRVRALLETPAAVRFLSCEPLLGPVDLSAWLKRVQLACERCCPPGPLDFHSAHLWGNCRCACHPEPPTGPDWVIVGGESGPRARPMHPGWARLLRDQCTAAEVPFFFKQWGEWAPTGRVAIGTTDQRNRLAGDADNHGFREEIRRYGKHATGRVLDGQTWDQFPHTTTDGRQSA